MELCGEIHQLSRDRKGLRALIGGFVTMVVGGSVGGSVGGFVGVVIGGLIGGFVGGFISGFVGGFVVVFGLSFVFDIGNVAGVTVHVVRHHLAAAIGKHHVVLTVRLVSVAFLAVAHVDVSVIVLHGVIEVVVRRGLEKTSH